MILILFTFGILTLAKFRLIRGSIVMELSDQLFKINLNKTTIIKIKGL